MLHCDILVIGGGAAGFFAAIRAAECAPHATVILAEKQDKPLQKVRVSGGGRCNLTNGAPTPALLLNGYPRGRPLMKKLLFRFNNQHAIQWFRATGVPVKTEPDGRVFPVSDSSADVIKALTDRAARSGVRVMLQAPVTALTPSNGMWTGQLNGQPFTARAVIFAGGGHPTADKLARLQALGQPLVPPVPSLFTFNMPHEPVRDLMGVSVANAVVRIQGTKLESDGPLLITHWGMSGPAILRLSAFGARHLADIQYRFAAQITWSANRNEQAVREQLSALRGPRLLRNQAPFGLPGRLWTYLLQRAAISPDQRWDDIQGKAANKLVNVLQNDTYQVSGKTTFKEEFVTCGGVALEGVDHSTMQSKHLPGLFFAGEVLDIDGITGGYNFQAAWTTGWVAGEGAAVLVGGGVE
jgi:hypothetical protein